MVTERHQHELKPPPAAAADPDANEVLRAWIVKGGLQVSLVRTFDDPTAWGMLLVDIAWHVARIYAAEGDCSEAEAITQIRSMWDAEMTRATDLGTTGPFRDQLN